jgi:hypothetical protein
MSLNLVEQPSDPFLNISKEAFSDRLLPNFDLSHIQQLGRAGIDGIGIAQAIIETGDDPKIVLFEHANRFARAIVRNRGS